ncbi:major facilitator superfamily domain-containing protein 6 [Hyalella azteca]|uniref:Major facilitator superfamily domain-containing protein 6 n=1 Tax=Hyalella azteca TaxID=294128 RepID=A0A8B7PBT4_HYAAZ|nr:major facilitator superfamily domain-containing protein 6 [Hyalella azteca]
MENPQQVPVPIYNPVPKTRERKNNECVNRKLIVPKLLLMTFYGALGCLLPFLTLHMKHLGLTHDEITWINSVLPLTSIWGPPLAGFLADRSGRHKAITILAMLLAALFHMLLLFVPPCDRVAPHPPPLQFWCNNERSHLSLVPCDAPFFGNPCDKYSGHLRMLANFRLDNCRYHCSNATTAFLFDNPEDDMTMDSEDSLQGLQLPTIEQSLPASLPMVCFVDASGRQECRTMATSEHSLTFRRPLVLEDVTRVADARIQTCQFEQGESTYEGSAFHNVVCPTDSQCSVVCDAAEQSNGTMFLQTGVCESVEGNPQVTFWVYFVVRALADLFPTVLISLLDAMVLTMVTQYNGDFGRQKMFGLVSVGITAPLVGILMDGRFGSYGNLKYGPVFYVFTALMLVSAVITLFLPFQVELRTNSLLKSLSLLFRNGELVVLFLIMFVLGSFWSYLETFFYIYLESLHAPKLLIGLTITIGIVPSIPFLFKSERIVNYCGHHHLLMLAFVMYCIRFLGFAYMRNPWWSMPLEVLELFTLNMLQVAASTLAFVLAPKSLVATAQAFVFIAHFTFGRCVGALVSGVLIDAYGMIKVFLGASAVSGLLGAVYFISYYCIRWRNKKTGRSSRQAGKQNNSQLTQHNANGDQTALIGLIYNIL